MELKLFEAYATLAGVSVDLLCAQVAYESAQDPQGAKHERHAAAGRLPIVISDLSEQLGDYRTYGGRTGFEYQIRATDIRDVCLRLRNDADYRSLSRDVRRLVWVAARLINANENGAEQGVDVLA